MSVYIDDRLRCVFCYPVTPPRSLVRFAWNLDPYPPKRTVFGQFGPWSTKRDRKFEPRSTNSDRLWSISTLNLQNGTFLILYGIKCITQPITSIIWAKIDQDNLWTQLNLESIKSFMFANTRKTRQPLARHRINVGFKSAIFIFDTFLLLYLELFVLMSRLFYWSV